MGKALIIDSFAGGGGASTGIEIALGRSPDYALNHDAVALGVHAANHPRTKHLVSNIWQAEPRHICMGRPVGLLWASPDCKHFSKAKGGKPVEKSIRGLARAILMWALTVHPRIIILENVEEFQGWGPLLADNTPCPDRKGEDFDKFIDDLRAPNKAKGKPRYRVEWKQLRGCDYGSPTIRNRLFIIARCDGKPIVWPKPTHGKPDSQEVLDGKLKPWPVAADCIDWSRPCPSIFATSKQIMEQYGIRAIRPLAAATMARIARGVERYVLNAVRPFLIPVVHTGDVRTYPIDEPHRTITCAHRGEQALVQPFITKFNRGATGHPINDPLHTITSAHSETRPGGAVPLGLVLPFLAPRYQEKPGQEPRTRSVVVPAATIVAGGNVPGMLVSPLLSRQFGASTGSSVSEPAPTVMPHGGGKTAIVAAFLAQHNGGMVGHSADEPVSTIVQKGPVQAVVSAGMISMKGSDRRGRSVEEPTTTQTAGGWHQAEVRAFLVKYFGTNQDPRLDDPLHTATSKARFGLVTVHGEPYQIVDIGMRMLTPRELFRAQGFPDFTAHLEGKAWLDRTIHQAGARHFRESPEAAKSAQPSSSPELGSGSIEPVAVYVRIDLGQKVLEIRNVEKNPLCANTAEASSTFHLPTELDDFALRNALMHSCKGHETLVGAEARSPNGRPFTHPKDGACSVLSSGVETTLRAVDAETGISIEIDASKFITSLGGPHSRRFGSTLTTLFSFVARAIGSCIQNETLTATLFNVNLSFEWHYIIDRQADGTPISKTDQIRLCGNSVCPQVAAALVAANYVEVEVSDDRPVPAFQLEAAE